MPESNDDILVQLQASTAGAELSDADVMAQLNREPDPDPLADVEYTDNLEEDSKRELTALEQGFRDRAKREKQRFELATDTEYWCCLCFKTRADKEQFLRETGLDQIADKYLNGHMAAQVLGVELEGGDSDA